MLRALDRHWFAPASLRDLAIVRLLLVGAQLLLFYPELSKQLNRVHGDPELFSALPILQILMLPLGVPDFLSDPLLRGPGIQPDPMLVHAVWWFGIPAGLAAFVGLWTNPSLLLFGLANMFLVAHKYSYSDLHHPEALICLALVALALSPCGARWSLDDLKRRLGLAAELGRFEPAGSRDDQSPFARWPLRLMQWMLALTYLSAGIQKLYWGGLAWMNGYTLSYYLMMDSARHASPLAMFVAGFPLLLVLLSIVTILYELFFALAIFVPWLTWVIVLTGWGLHLGIALTLRAGFYPHLFLMSVFIENLRLGLPRRWRSRARPAPDWRVIYDGRCPLCIRSMVLLEYLDAGRRLDFLDLETQAAELREIAPDVTPQQARHEMHAVGPNGEVVRGFWAFRALVRQLCLLWPLLPLFYAPGAERLGPRLYAWVAGRRTRVECRTAACAL